MKQSANQEVVDFESSGLICITMTLVVVGIGITYGLVVQSEVRADIDQYECASGYTWNSTGVNSSTDCILNTSPLNATLYSGNTGTNPAYQGATDSINATAKISSKLGMIVTVIVAAVVIGILVR